jgi:hypothetical protein
MNATKNKKNTIAEHLKGLGTERKCRAFVRFSASGREKHLNVKSERTELPPRIRKLISAAVRVFELKRGIHASWPRARAYQS